VKYFSQNNSFGLKTPFLILASSALLTDLPGGLDDFFRLIEGEKPRTDFGRQVEASVEKAKRRPDIRRDFMKYEMDMQDIAYEAEKRGIVRGKREGDSNRLTADIEKLMQHLRSADPSLSEEDARKKAKDILL
jgi:hypothetical protein